MTPATPALKAASDLHDEAMDIAEYGLSARSRGFFIEAANLFTAAYEIECRAVDLVVGDHDLEPTRSIMLRSAATLAFSAGLNDEAEQLIGIALAGRPPGNIRQELLDLSGEINSSRKPERRDATMDVQSWQADRVTLGRDFLRDMERLWRQVLKQAAVVETTLSMSVKALCDGRPDLADEVESHKESIDRCEVQIERDCLKILALHLPVLSDLRRVVGILRINADLERLADLARHIAKRARKLAEEPIGRALPRGLEVMAAEAMQLVRESFDALTQRDVDRARAVIAGDRKIDRHSRAIIEELKQAIREDPDRLDSWLRLIKAARNLERVADHAINIAEAVIYLKEGEIIRGRAAQVPGP